jgi:hypothetical protein
MDSPSRSAKQLETNAKPSEKIHNSRFITSSYHHPDRPRHGDFIAVPRGNFKRGERSQNFLTSVIGALNCGL